MLPDDPNPQPPTPSPQPPVPHGGLALIAAPRRQLPFAASPAHLFSASEFFTLAYTLATHTARRTVILSPHYGLLLPDGDPIAPYAEESWDDWLPARRHAWTAGVLAALRPLLRPGDPCTFYVGRGLRSELAYKLTALGHPCVAPLAGLDPDAQLAHLQTLAAAWTVDGEQ